MSHPKDVRPSFLSFADELTKIASGDLMNPAVGSDSAAVSGPPAAPFASRKGYRKLERTSVVKEASPLGDLTKAGLRKTRGLGRLAARKVKNIGPTALATYSRLPKPVQDFTHTVIQNPSDWASAPDTIMRLLGR